MKSKIIENKKIKENNLLQAAFNLFTKEDITNVSVNDIVKNAGVAKGTFYLYFKDKYQIRDILIQKEAHRLFEEAHKQLEKNDIRNFEDSVIFLINQVLIRLESNPLILKFVERNLSWGVFHTQLNTAIDNDSFNLFVLAGKRFAYIHFWCTTGMGIGRMLDCICG